MSERYLVINQRFFCQTFVIAGISKVRRVERNVKARIQKQRLLDVGGVGGCFLATGLDLFRGKRKWWSDWREEIVE
ncbi:MAG: hypothetical protein JSR97_03900 [Verrucomicrobia bacterium]|nr:hypothetical protein [Verrucomicrobiota bacterium]